VLLLAARGTGALAGGHQAAAGAVGRIRNRAQAPVPPQGLAKKPEHWHASAWDFNRVIIFADSVREPTPGARMAEPEFVVEHREHQWNLLIQAA